MNPFALSRIGQLPLAQLPPRQALRRAAAQFEGVFMRQLLRDDDEGLAGPDGDDVFADSPAMAQYTDMLHAVLVEHNAGSLGIGQMLVEQLGGPSPPAGGDA